MIQLHQKPHTRLEKTLTFSLPFMQHTKIFLSAKHGCQSYMQINTPLKQCRIWPRHHLPRLLLITSARWVSRSLGSLFSCSIKNVPYQTIAQKSALFFFFSNLKRNITLNAFERSQVTGYKIAESFRFESRQNTRGKCL